MKWAIGGTVVLAALLIFIMFLSPSDDEVHFINSENQIEKAQDNSEDPFSKLKKNSKTVTPSAQAPANSNEDPWKNYDKAKAREVLKDEGLPMGASSYTGPRPLSEEEMEKMDQVFESYEKGWDKKMRDLMQTQLGMSEEDYGDYLKMRDGYEEDRLEAFESFHERMAQERGPHYSYSPTQEMIDFDKKLRQEYLDLYRNRYGEEAFARYMDALEKYNDKIRREADPAYGVINIEF